MRGDSFRRRVEKGAKVIAIIIGNIAAAICVISTGITLYYVNATNNTRRKLQWLGVMFVSLVIAYATIPFR